MSRLRNLTIGEFAEYLDARPAHLGVWRDGLPGRATTLEWLCRHAAAEVQELAQTAGVRNAAFLTNSGHHNAVGIAAGWVIRHMTGAGRATPVPDQDRKALFVLAGRQWMLKNALAEVRAGVRGFESRGSVVRLPYEGFSQIDALDRIFDMIEHVRETSHEIAPLPDRLRPWLGAAGRRTAWVDAPGWVRKAIRSRARDLIAVTEQHLDAHVQIGAFRVEDYDRFWVELLAIGSFALMQTIAGSPIAEFVLPRYQRDAFVSLISAEASIGEAAANAITQLLILDLDRFADASITPLVELDGVVYPVNALVTRAYSHRNLLALLAADPGCFGEAGRLLGTIGERETVATLERMDDRVIVGHRIKVRRGSGQLAGDLDVVVCDPVTRVVAILEIKWHIAADGNVEVYRAERLAVQKREQVTRLRAEIEAGEATVCWPDNWPDLSGWTTRWFVLTRDVLAQRDAVRDGVTIRSLQLLRFSLRAGASGADLIAALDNPPVPPAELSETFWARVRYGEISVDVEHIKA